LEKIQILNEKITSKSRIFKFRLKFEKNHKVTGNTGILGYVILIVINLISSYLFLMSSLYIDSNYYKGNNWARGFSQTYKIFAMLFFLISLFIGFALYFTLKRKKYAIKITKHSNVGNFISILSAVGFLKGIIKVKTISTYIDSRPIDDILTFFLIFLLVAIFIKVMRQKEKIEKRFVFLLRKIKIKLKNQRGVQGEVTRICLIIINLTSSIIFLLICIYLKANYPVYNWYAIRRFNENHNYAILFAMICFCVEISLFFYLRNLKENSPYPQITHIGFSFIIISITGLVKAITKLLLLPTNIGSNRVDTISGYIFAIFTITAILEIICKRKHQLLKTCKRNEITQFMKKFFVLKKKTKFQEAFVLLKRIREIYDNYKLELYYTNEDRIDFKWLKKNCQREELEFKIQKFLSNMLMEHPRISLLELTTVFQLHKMELEKIVINLINSGKIKATYDYQSYGINSRFVQEELDKLIHQYEEWEKTGKAKLNKIECV
jgi:hypothetical protein